jgi:hypothetical protein
MRVGEHVDLIEFSDEGGMPTLLLPTDHRDFLRTKFDSQKVEKAQSI